MAEFEYVAEGGSITIIGYTGTGGDVAIPGTIEDQPVTGIADLAFWGRTNLTRVLIPGSVAEIDRSAFEGCTGLTNVEIPESVGRINSSTFSDCANLIHVIIHSGVESIGFRAFAGCLSLTHIAIPDSVTSFDTNRVGGIESFLGCTNLTAIEVNPLNPVYSSLDGVLLDKDRTRLVLYPSGKKGDYSVPGGVVSIGPMAFNDCAELTALVVPDSVTTIGYGAFSGCVDLKSVIIAENLTDVGLQDTEADAASNRFYRGIEE